MLNYSLPEIVAFGEKRKPEKDKVMLIHLCYLFLGAVVSQSVYSENIQSSVPLWRWTNKDDIAFMLLVLENYFKKWAAEVNGSANSLIPQPTFTGRGLSHPNGQKRFQQLKMKVELFFSTELDALDFQNKFQLYVNNEIAEQTALPRALYDIGRITALDEPAEAEWDVIMDQFL